MQVHESCLIYLIGKNQNNQPYFKASLVYNIQWLEMAVFLYISNKNHFSGDIYHISLWKYTKGIPLQFLVLLSNTSDSPIMFGPVQMANVQM